MKQAVLILLVIILCGCNHTEEVIFQGETLPAFGIMAWDLEWRIICEDGVAYTIMEPKTSNPHFTELRTSDGRTCLEVRKALKGLEDGR